MDDPISLQLCYAWGCVCDQDVLILFVPGSTHNFISLELAQRLGISTEELGPALEASGAFKRQEVQVTPLIGKLRLHVQGYTDDKEFFVSPLLHKDVILGTPWFHRVYANLESSRSIKLQTRDREIKIKSESKGNTIPVVISDSIQKLIKSSTFEYFVCAQPLQSTQFSLPIEA